LPLALDEACTTADGYFAKVAIVM